MVNIVFSEKKEKNKKNREKRKKSVIWIHVTVILLVIFGYISPKTAFIFLLTRYFIVSG